MYFRRTGYPLLVFISLALLLLPSRMEAKQFGKGKNTGHEADMYAVLPFQKSAGISAWLESVHKTIDFPYNKYFDGLRDAPHQKFSWGKYGHRIFFHWGFNSEPWSPQIQEQIDKCGWDRETILSFRAKLTAEQAGRNRAIMKQTGILFHFGLSGQERAYANGLASIVSDVHLLGDFTTENIAPLPNLQYVINDIKTTLSERLSGDEQARRINRQLDATRTNYPDTKARAQAVLDILKKEFPRFLLTCNKGYFKKHFAGYGIPLKKL